ncbi:unnamed protein product, partial [marine sediment metagenome]
DRYGDPPLKVEFNTGLDALLTELGDKISVTDSDADMADIILDMFQFKKDFVAAPKKVGIIAANDTTTGRNWMFWGSTADEGDGISPQASSYGSANDTDKQYGYWGDTTSPTTAPTYYFF